MTSNWQETTHTSSFRSGIRFVVRNDSENDMVIAYTLHIQSPPQLWKMETPHKSARLKFRHVFSSTVSVEYVGSTFAGKNDQFILCAGKCLILHCDLSQSLLTMFRSR